MQYGIHLNHRRSLWGNEANPWIPTTAKSLTPELELRLSGSCFLDTTSRLGKQGQDGTTLLRIDDQEVQWALHYFYTCATGEVEKFVKSATVARVAVKKYIILFCKSRALEGQCFACACCMDNISIIRDQGINIHCQVIETWSPLPYAIADNLHKRVGSYRQLSAQSTMRS